VSDKHCQNYLDIVRHGNLDIPRHESVKEHQQSIKIALKFKKLLVNISKFPFYAKTIDKFEFFAVFFKSKSSRPRKKFKMGVKQSKFLDAVLHDIEADRPVDVKDMKTVFDSFDKDKSGHLERAEVDKFMEFLFDYVYDLNHPADVTKMHTKGFLRFGTGMNISRRTKPTAIETSQFKKEVLALLDVDKDGKLSWDEFYSGVTAVLKNKIVDAPVPVGTSPMHSQQRPTLL
jgi:Ca2+-binding EF-hand superfamily protein